MSESVFELIDRLGMATRINEGHDILRGALEEMGLCHVAYAAINLPTLVRERPLVAVTYSAEWQRHYAQEGYVNVDPIMLAGLGGILPVDWTSIPQDSRVAIKFFGEAQEFNVGKTGLSIPIRGRHGEFAILSVTSQVGQREWLALKKVISRDIMLLA